MYRINANFLKYPGAYLFLQVAKKREAFAAAHPDRRIISPSTQPPRTPQRTPTAVPTAVITATSASVESTLVCSPTKIRESRSRPYRSVPAGWARLGASRAAKLSWYSRSRNCQ